MNNKKPVDNGKRLLINDLKRINRLREEMRRRYVENDMIEESETEEESTDMIILKNMINIQRMLIEQEMEPELNREKIRKMKTMIERTIKKFTKYINENK